MNSSAKIDQIRYKFDSTRRDAEETNNRYTNYVLCLSKYFHVHPTVSTLKRQLIRHDLNEVCKFELLALRQMADDTDFRYESFHKVVDPYVIDNLK